MEKGKYGILVGNSSDKLKLEAVLVVSDDTVLEQMDKICPLQEELEQIYLTKELKEKSVQRQEKLITAQVPEYYFKPAMIPAKSEKCRKKSGKSDRGRKKICFCSGRQNYRRADSSALWKDFREYQYSWCSRDSSTGISR